jgi:predicted nucleic-acid-binding Zn-ribbon protein
MNKFSQEKKEDIVKILKSRGAKLPCPRCGKNDFMLIDGYFIQSIQKNVADIVLGGEAIPSIVVVCANCGYLSQHALAPLGLLPKEEKENEK